MPEVGRSHQFSRGAQGRLAQSRSERVESEQLLRDAGLDAVVGMYPVVHRLRSTVVLPWRGAALGDPAIRPPWRVLLHGAPGCGATFIAERLAHELESVAGVSAAVVTTLDDEARRDVHDLLEALTGPPSRDLLLVGVSYRPWDLPREVFGEAGFQRLAFVPPPDWDARRFRLWEQLAGSGIDPDALDDVVAATEGWSGVDLAGLADVDVAGLADAVAARTAQGTDASRWLAESRALVSRLSGAGMVDDLKGYLQRYRLL